MTGNSHRLNWSGRRDIRQTLRRLELEPGSAETAERIQALEKALGATPPEELDR